MQPDDGLLSGEVAALVGASAHPGVITCAHSVISDSLKRIVDVSSCRSQARTSTPCSPIEQMAVPAVFFFFLL